MADREEVLNVLMFHVTSPTHPTACLCGMWDGRLSSFNEHLADALMEVFG